jgi:hypothetical protein
LASRNPFEKRNGQLFSLPKRKKLAKKKLATLQVDRLAPINCLARRFSASKGAVPQMAASPTPEAKRLEAVGSRTVGFDLMGAVLARPRHANHGTQTVWVCVPRFVGIVIKWMQVCADGTSPPPLGDLFPPSNERSASFSPSAGGISHSFPLRALQKRIVRHRCKN